MTDDEHDAILRLLDHERRTIHAGPDPINEMGIVKALSADGMTGEIVYSSCTDWTGLHKVTTGMTAK